MKFQRHYSNSDGSTSVWHFDTQHSDINPVMVEELEVGEVPSSTIRVEKRVASLEKRVQHPLEKRVQKKSLPKTKQKYLNPKTGKEVGYVRAKNLGLI